MTVAFCRDTEWIILRIIPHGRDDGWLQKMLTYVYLSAGG